MKKQQFETSITQSYFSVFGPLKKPLNISSPVKCVDNGQYEKYLSPASKIKFERSMEHGHQFTGVIFSGWKCADGLMEVSPKTKKPRI